MVYHRNSLRVGNSIPILPRCRIFTKEVNTFRKSVYTKNMSVHKGSMQQWKNISENLFLCQPP